MLGISTERDDYIRQVATGSYGLSRENWVGTTRFINVYEKLHLSDFQNSNRTQKEVTFDKEQLGPLDLYQAKLELEYQIYFLNKHNNELSKDGNECIKKMLALFDEAHSVLSGYFYRTDYENVIGKDVNIDRIALLDGIIKQLTLFIENKGKKTGTFLFADVQKIKEWKVN